MGMFSRNKKEVKENATLEKNVAKKVDYSINNKYAMKNFKVNYFCQDISVDVESDKFITFKAKFYVSCDRGYCFRYNRNNQNLIISNGEPQIYVEFKIYKDGIKDERGYLYLGETGYDSKIDYCTCCIEEMKDKIQKDFYIPEETKRFILASINTIRYSKDVSFARRFVANPEEFERMLKHINHPEANIKPNTNVDITNSQVSADKALLKAKRNELLSANASRNSATSNNYENDPLGEYIANQAKQKRKQI